MTRDATIGPRGASVQRAIALFCTPGLRVNLNATFTGLGLYSYTLVTRPLSFPPHGVLGSVISPRSVEGWCSLVWAKIHRLLAARTPFSTGERPIAAGQCFVTYSLRALASSWSIPTVGFRLVFAQVAARFAVERLSEHCFIFDR